MAGKPDTLILCAGGLRSLVALAIHKDAGGPAPAVLYVHDGREASRQRFEHVHRQADFMGVAKVHELKLPHLYGRHITRGADGAAVSPLSTPQLLLAAVQHAHRLELPNLVWPAARGEDATASALATEQAVLVQHLHEAETSGATAGNVVGSDTPKFCLHTPLIDLTPPQLLERGQRVDANWALAWTCLLGGDRSCGACAGCRSRRRAFDTAKVVDPLEPSPHADRAA